MPRAYQYRPSHLSARIYERKSKDYEFSYAFMSEHWQGGLQDTIATLRHPEWLTLPSGARGTVTHDVARTGAAPPDGGRTRARKSGW